MTESKYYAIMQLFGSNKAIYGTFIGFLTEFAHSAIHIKTKMCQCLPNMYYRQYSTASIYLNFTDLL